jgi:hypothetical protein
MLKTILGPSWLPSLLGYIVAIVVAVQDYLSTNGDLSKMDYMKLVTAVAIAVFGRATKMVGVSNAPHPLASAAAVTPANEIKTKPL